MEFVQKLTKDLQNASKALSDAEARYLVDMYYTTQKQRMASASQIRELTETNEPCNLLKWVYENNLLLEKEIKKGLHEYVKEHPIGKWLDNIAGIGPVLAAGLLAHIDITKAPTVGHIWSYAGLDPNRKWLGKEKSRALVESVIGKEKKITEEHLIQLSNESRWGVDYLNKARNKNDKLCKDELIKKISFRPWNAELKTLVWKLGQSFVKVSGKENDAYGKIYKLRKQYEIAKNEQFAYREQADYILKHKRIDKKTEAFKAYSQGKLPLGHIQQRSERYASKIFLSHLHHVWYKHHYKTEPPKPYAIAILGHAHYIPPQECEDENIQKIEDILTKIEKFFCGENIYI